MSVKTSDLQLKLRGDTQVENITKRVADVVAGSGLKAGIVVVFIKHTTAAVMIARNAMPSSITNDATILPATAFGVTSP